MFFLVEIPSASFTFMWHWYPSTVFSKDPETQPSQDYKYAIVNSIIPAIMMALFIWYFESTTYHD
eukprot:UN10013